MKQHQNITHNNTPLNKDLEILKQHFPNCFDKDGDFDFEKFKKQLSEKEVNFSRESYGMDWLGKSYARLLATDETTTLLTEDDTHNQKEENKNSENLLLKGDNLEILKHLSHAYYEKIKMIYIDPPYNTGSDGFVYADDRKFTYHQLRDLAGISEERAKRILEFTQSNSNSHSAWLTFMYPRLYVAKQLLKDDGVIFISIDDNEVAQLRLLCDEIFGEENFVGELIWETATDNNKSQISVEHEYILCFSKNKELQFNWEIKSSKANIIQQKYEELKSQNIDIKEIQKKLKRWITSVKKSNEFDLSGVSHYSYIDEKGVYYPGNSNNTKKGNYNYDIVHPITNQSCKKPSNGWRWPEETFSKAQEKGDVEWGKDETTIPKIKKRLETATELLKSYYYEDNRVSTNYLKSLFGVKVFENPKSVNLIKKLIKFTTNSSDIIIDFFAGSGTTADAVMQLNAEDGGNRKFILAQLPELIDPKKSKTAYDFVKNELKKENPVISDITQERIIRSAKKIQTDNIVETEHTLSLHQDFGFKIFETMPIWDNYHYEVHILDSIKNKLFDEAILTPNDINALLVTWKTYDGLTLTQSLQEIDLDGYKGYYGYGKLYLMDKGFQTKNLKSLLEKIDKDSTFNPTAIIAFGYHFESKNLREISENVKSYANKKSIDVDFIVRY
ncbi:MAG: hypothetical protein KGV44_02960 [Flavobacteriaceae bacterium]|nr:hypothetical protein [Flavobacteriaceae bacterium]